MRGPKTFDRTVYIHTYMHTYIYIHANMYTHVHTCIHIYICILKYMHIYVSIVFIYLYILSCVIILNIPQKYYVAFLKKRNFKISKSFLQIALEFVCRGNQTFGVCLATSCHTISCHRFFQKWFFEKQHHLLNVLFCTIMFTWIYVDHATALFQCITDYVVQACSNYYLLCGLFSNELCLPSRPALK